MSKVYYGNITAEQAVEQFNAAQVMVERANKGRPRLLATLDMRPKGKGGDLLTLRLGGKLMHLSSGQTFGRGKREGLRMEMLLEVVSCAVADTLSAVEK